MYAHAQQSSIESNRSESPALHNCLLSSPALFHTLYQITRTNSYTHITQLDPQTDTHISTDFLREM